MAIQIEVFVNSDDAFVAWRSDRPIADCIGFELRRKRNGKLEVVRNRVSFSGTEPDPGTPESSRTSPLRRYAWTDHEANSGDKVAYQVAPVIQRGRAAPTVDEAGASNFTRTVDLSGRVDDAFECYFNRGLILSQFMSRALKGNLSGKSLAAFKKGLNDRTESRLRVFLGGDLRVRLLELLDGARKDKGHIYAALYELSDEVLIERLVALGARAHVVLANGSHTSRDDDGNADARQTLTDAGCEIIDRMLPAKVLGHNKFMVVCDKAKAPRAVWTGSTNWSPTGLCTQINNGLLVNDEPLAAVFLDQWERLRAAGSETPRTLVAENSKAKVEQVGSSEVAVWFTRSSKAPEMDAVIELVDSAKQGVAFLMFQPGGSPILDAIVARQADPKLFVKGVISTMEAQDLDEAKVTLVQRGGKQAHKFRIVQPQGLREIGRWAAEVSRASFLGQVGFAIVHSKLIVIDPSGSEPVVITGSHNFSGAASSRNDENLVIIRGNAALAHAYAVNVQSVFDHYNFRAVARSMEQQGKDLIEVMRDPKSWQAAWFTGDKQRELDFWLG